MFKRNLMHDRLLIRFGSSLGMVLIIFLGTLIMSYIFLPEGILRGRSVAQVLAGDDLAGGSVWLEWLRIFAINLGVLILVISAPNLLRIEGDYPLGYNTATLIAIYYGVLLGTDSFTFSMGGKIPPTIAIFGRSGIYEITAYVLAAAATAFISKFRLVGKWPKQTIEKIILPQSNSVIKERNVGFILSIIILLIACGWEAYNISLALAR